MKRSLSALWLPLIILGGVSTTVFLLAGGSDPMAQWPMMGQDLNNWRYQPTEHALIPSSVPTLSVKWSFTTGGDVSATPTVTNDAVYFPDWGGNLFAVGKDGKQIWANKISVYDGHPGAISRVSPAIHGDDLILGDILDSKAPHAGANMMAVNRATGSLHWITQVDTHPAAVITGSPIVTANMILVGVSSTEESLAVDPSYPCCSFRGSIVALDANTGRILWKTYTVPDNRGQTDGYSGNAVWQPPALDIATGNLYVGTGNNYEVPGPVKNCIAHSAPIEQPDCFASDDFFDSALALDVTTGRIKWSRRLQGIDVWTVACIKDPNPVACPIPSSPDFDLGGSGPNILPGMVGFGQKSGIYWALDSVTGNIVWSTVVGPGSSLGGIEWGTASDGQRIYVAIANGGKKPYTLIDGETVTSGAWSALDVTTGKILWQTADPDGAFDIGSVSVASNVVYAPSFSGTMNALDARTGKIVWSFQSGGSVIDGPAIVDGVVYWGSGYKNISPGTANNKVFAFSLPAPVPRGL
jgi:polyvinyl alcohol dehydrogenase (cytochrome)